MKYVFDTHIILWALIGGKYLPESVKDIIKDNGNDIYYSTVSPWEIEIKHLKMKNFKLSGEQFVFLCEQNGLINISVKTQHISKLKNIVASNDIKHNDPFDKMLLAQSISENMIFVTHDKKFKAYDIQNIMFV